MTYQVISKTGQKNYQFSQWDTLNEYKRYDVVSYQGDIYQANGDMPANTSFVAGSIGMTWTKVIQGGNTTPFIGGNLPGNILIDANGNVSISAAGTANALVVTANGTTIAGNLTLSSANSFTIPGGQDGDFLTTDGNGHVSWGNISASMATTGVNTTGNITTTGDVSSSNLTVAQTITGNTANFTTVNTTSNALIGGNLITAGNTFIGGTANVSGNLNTSGNLNANGNITTNSAIIANGAITSNSTITGNVLTGNTIIATGPITTGGPITAGEVISNTTVTANGNITSNSSILANGNITSNGTVSGNVISGNTITTSGEVTANGNITSNGTVSGNTISGNTITTSGEVTANGNITSNGTVSGNTISGNTVTSNVVTANTVTSNVANIINLNVSGNANLGDVGNLTILGGSNGQFLMTDGNGNVSWANSGVSAGNTGITASNTAITSNVAGNTIQILDANGTSTTGNANVSGNITANGNVTAGNITTNGTVTTQTLYSNTTIMANGNIMSNGAVIGNIIQGNTANFSNLNVTGNANLGSAANLTITGGNIGESLLTLDTLGNVGWGIADQIGNGNSYMEFNQADGWSNIYIGGNRIAEVSSGAFSIIGNSGITGFARVFGPFLDFYGDLRANGTTSRAYLKGTEVTELRVNSSASFPAANVITVGGSTANGQVLSMGNTSNGTLAWANISDILANAPGGANLNSNVINSNTIIANGNITSNGTVSGNTIQGNTIQGNTANFGNLNITGNANLGSAANLTITGGTLGQSLVSYGNGAVTWDFANSLQHANSSIEIDANGMLFANLRGSANALYMDGTGAIIKGLTVANGGMTVIGNLTVTGTSTLTGSATYFGLSPVNPTAGSLTLPIAGRIFTSDTTTAGQVLAAQSSGGNLYWTNVSDLIANAPGGSNLTSNVINSNTIIANGNITGGNITSNGNITGGNITSNGNITGGNITATGNVTANYIIANGSQLTSLNGANVTGTVANANYAAYAGNITIAGQANITSVGNLTSLTVAGNSNLGSNANLKLSGGSNGQALFTDGAGNLSWVTITANAIFNGNSNVSIPAAGGNVNISAAGNANVVVVTGNGLNITGRTTTSNGLTITGGGASITGDLGLNGNLNVIGNVNYNNVAQLVIGDPLIFIASNNGTDVVDSGLVSTYNSNVYTGIARNKNNGVWTVFDNLPTSPTSVIDWGSANAGKFLAGNTTVSSLTASGLVTLGNVSNVKINGGAAGQLLSTDGTGGLSWVAVSGGANYIANGVSNLQFTGSGGNLIGAVDGTANSFFVSPTVFTVKSLSIALGTGNSGTMTPGVDYRIAVGYQAGDSSQATNTVAIGNAAGKSSQAANSVAIGAAAGQTSQAFGAVSIGSGAGRQNQGANAVAIGLLAGYSTQGINSVAIGQGAGAVSQHANTIILNATGSNVNSTATDSFYVAPIRNASTGNIVFYDPTTKEVTYGVASVPAGANFANFAGNVTVAAQPNITSVGTLTSLTVSGIANLGAVGNVKVTGGSTGQVLGTDGTGNLAWVSVSAAATANFANFAGNVTVAAQPNITSVGTLTSLAVTGNISGGSISSAGSIIAASIVQGNSLTSLGPINAVGNITGANITGAHYGAGNNLSNIQGANVTGNVTSAVTANFANFAGNITVAAQPNITSIGTLTSLTVSGNVTGGNLVTTGTVITANLNATGANVSLGFVSNVRMTGGTSGQFLQTDGSGTLSWATVSLGAASNISNGTSNVGIDTLNGNIAFKVNGTANVAFFSATGANFAGTANVVGNLSAGNVGVVGAMTAGGNVQGGNILTGGVVNAVNTGTFGNVVSNANMTTANFSATGANVSLGNVANLKITGGTSGQFLQTNGSGTLTWATQSAIAESIANGTSNLGFTASNGNLIGGIAGTANAFFVSDSMFAVKSEDIIIGKGTDSTITANRGRVVIGNTAGSLTQAVAGIVIGSGAGKNQTGVGAIAIGAGSGFISQGATAVALGYGAGFSGAQGAGGVAIGGNAALNGQGANSVAIGYHAGKGAGGQPTNSIVINATGADLNAAAANSLYVAPIRNATSANTVFYDPSTKEMTYGLATAAVPTSLVNGTSNVVVASSGFVTIGVAGTANAMKVTQAGTIVSGSFYANGITTLQGVSETFTTKTNATGVVAHDCSAGGIFYHTSITANFTVNLISVPVSTGTASVITLMLNQGATAYMPTALQISTVAQTIKWQGGTVPTGNANKLDAVAFTIFGISTGVYTVTGQLVSYG